VYLWQVGHTAVHGNTIRNVSDGIHLEFSDHNGIGANLVTRSRYGLHFMSSDDNTVLENTFKDNLAGAVLMFSHNLLLKDNEFSGNRKGATGAGILLKDCDNIFAEGNRLLRNKYGMSVEGTPQSVGATAVFMHNLYALNETGLGLMSNAPITFVENAMIDNTVQVQIFGRDAGSRLLSTHGDESAAGAHAEHPGQPRPGEAPKLPEDLVWALNGRGNYWSDYRGYDADGDGVGDKPYLPEPPFAGQLAENPGLRLFQYTLAQQAIDLGADLFPVYQYKAVLEDEGPLMEPPPGLEPAKGDSFNGRLLVVSVLLLVGAAWIAGSLLEFAPAEALRRVWRPARGPVSGGTPA